MHIYVEKPRFSQIDGQKVQSVWVKSDAVLCDSTGEAFASCDSAYSIKIKYNHSSEPLYYYDKDREWFEERDASYELLMEADYHFGVPPEHEHQDLEEDFRLTRIKIVKKILKAKTLSLQQLGICSISIYANH